LVLWGITWTLFILDFGLGLFGLSWFGSNIFLPAFEAIVLMIFSFLALRQPIIKESEKGTVVDNPKRQPSLPLEKMKSIAKQLKCAMEQESLFLEEDLSLKKLSESIDVSENHISETLSQFLHSNFFHFVNSYRVEEAKSMLVSSTKTVAEIAYASGFNSKSTFNTAFKKMTNVTPTEYRKANS